jgi:predicted nucleotidyltransferase
VGKLLEGLLATWGERLVSLVVFGSVARGEA